jgi:putative ABC transport system permease protein
MDFFENISLALAGLKANKMRTALTMLGIIIGIAAVIAIMTVGSSVTNSVTSSLQGIGASNITVSLQQKDDENSNSGPFGVNGGEGMPVPGGGGGSSTQIIPQESDYITDQMITELREGYPDQIKHISVMESVGTGQVKEGHFYANVSVTGTNSEYNAVNDLKMQEGRYLKESDVLGGRAVAVVSDKLANNIFGAQDPLGKEIKVYLGKQIDVYTVVGVYKYENSAFNFSTASEQDVQTNLYIPVTVAKKLTGSGDGYQYFTIQTETGVDSETFMKQVDNFFDHYYARNQDFKVTASNMEALVSQFSSILDTLSLALSLIAAISLVVGGIGIMNILLVSITERTKEIGTRKALGATNGSIRMQFITEAVIICLIGGAIGIGAGIGLGALGSILLGFQAMASASSIFLALGVSTLIGIFFGYYPANKAAKMDPIEALRYE